jgi:hypothetical protein
MTKGGRSSIGRGDRHPLIPSAPSGAVDVRPDSRLCRPSRPQKLRPIIRNDGLIDQEVNP